METQINSISQLPLEITYDGVDAVLTFDKQRDYNVTITYLQRPNLLYYLLHETGAFYVVGESEEEAVIKMYNLLKEKNVI
jgi:hypothetical protein